MHYGSLVTALASYLQARVNGGVWIVRIEDIDPDRQHKSATQSILQTLQDYGFVWDKRPILQSRQHNLHKHIVEQLFERKLAYACSCSRKDLAALSTTGPMGAIYPGTCANKHINKEKHTVRVRSSNIVIHFIDKLFGPQSCHLQEESGDYVIFRADGLPSYILAASVDDVYENYTEVVRGADLLAITARQIHLSSLLEKTSPSFFHVPIITDQSGNKLSKQTHAPPLLKHHARQNLYFALQDLGQAPPRHLLCSPLSSLWQWALMHWNIEHIPQRNKIPFNH